MTPWRFVNRRRASLPGIDTTHSRPRNGLWLDQIFDTQTARRGGTVRRAIRDVELRVGRAALELEVRRRGFHTIETGGQFVIFCPSDPVRLVV